MLSINILLFGVFTDLAGTDKILLNINDSISDLKAYLSHNYPEFSKYSYRVAVNGKIAEDDTMLKETDEVAILPPFSGG